MAKTDKNDTFETLVSGPKCSGPKSIGPKLFQAEVFLLGRSRHRAKVFSGPKYFPGRNVL